MPEAVGLGTPLAYALQYAALGWYVLPLEPNAKQPLGRLVPRGMLDASLNSEVIASWWRTAPNAGVGIALAQSGLVAIDVDPRNGGTETFDDLQASHGSLRSAVMALTGGNGEHHVFVVPPGAQISLPGTLGPGIDLKANGYIVVEPSIHPSGKQYVWEGSSSPLEGVAPSSLPDWLRSLRAELRRVEPMPGGVAADPRKVREVREALYMLDVESRGEWLRAGMALHSTAWGYPAYAMWCAWSQQSTKFDATASRKTWESFQANRDGAIGLAWIFGSAQLRGWANPQARLRAVENDSPHGSQEGQSEERSSDLPILALAELRESAKSVKWLVKHVVPAESIGVVYGGSGTFKSFIAIDLALHVAHGLPWLGRKTRQDTVLIVAAEGGSGLWRRIVAWHREHHLKWQDVAVFVLPLAIDLGVDCARVVERASQLGLRPGLVIIDTLSQTFAGEENSAAEVSSYLRELGLWFRSSWQAAVLVVHHTGHQATERPRGSSAIRSNVDFMFGVYRDEKEMLATLECAKQKDGELFAPMTFALKVIDLAKDEDGDTITSLVASGICDTGQVVGFMDHEARRGRGGRNHLFLDLAINGIEEKKLRAVFCEAIDGDSETKRKAYFRARKWAISAGLIEIAEGFLIRIGDGT